MCSKFIKKHIMQLPKKQIFTTREMLQYGLRGSVDQALSRLVNANFIFRLTPGVFVRDGSYRPSREEIAKAKMAAWNKTLFIHAQNLLVALNLAPRNKEAPWLMAVNAHTTSFSTREGRVHLKGIGRRRVRLCQTKVGRIAYALWHLGERVCTKHHVIIATQTLKRSEREEFRLATAMMPAWLSTLCYFLFPSPKVTV